MKKLLVLILVLAFASAASATNAWFEVDPDDPDGADGYQYSDILTINVIADFDMGSFTIGSIDATAGTAEGLPTINPTMDLMRKFGTLTNSGGVLITGPVGAGILTLYFPPLPAGEIICSFEFHVPDVDPSTEITISDSGFVSFLYLGEEVSDMTDLVIHVTPEPMTIALLGLGGLFLRRRK